MVIAPASSRPLEHRPLGLIVNPKSGADVRRLIASAGTSTVDEKISIVRRVVLGAAEAGVERIIATRDPFRIVGRATETIVDGPSIEILDNDLAHRESDSVTAAAAMRGAGCGAVVVLGGDGTNRAVVECWPDVVLMPLSTGTNNAFPVHLEPTIAGVAAGLVASGAVSIDAAVDVAKVVHVAGPAGDEVALIDAVAVDDPHVGSLELFEPATLRLAVLTRADPAAIGFAGVGGLLLPCGPEEDAGLLVEFAESPSHPDASRVLRAPTAPGHHADLAIRSWRRLALGAEVTIEGPTILAYDGERHTRLRAGEQATLTIRRDGPRVIDAAAVLGQAAAKALFHRPVSG